MTQDLSNAITTNVDESFAEIIDCLNPDVNWTNFRPSQPPLISPQLIQDSTFASQLASGSQIESTNTTSKDKTKTKNKDNDSIVRDKMKQHKQKRLNKAKMKSPSQTSSPKSVQRLLKNLERRQNIATRKLIDWAHMQDDIFGYQTGIKPGHFQVQCDHCNKAKGCLYFAQHFDRPSRRPRRQSTRTKT